MTTTEQDFRAERRTGIGGSDIAAILGISKWATPLDVWRSKVLGDDTIESAPMEWGKRLEPVVLAKYADDSGAKLHVGRGVSDGIFRANIDALAEIDGELRVVEAKTTRDGNEWGTPGTDDVPDAYQAQGQWYLMLTALEVVDFPVLIAGSDFRIYTSKRHQQIIDMMRREAERFWREHVEKQVPPEPSNAAECNRAWTATTGRAVDLSDEILTAMRDREVWKQQIKALEESVERAEYAIKQALRDAEVGTINGQPVCTWKNQTSRRLDTDRIKTEAPDLYERFGRSINSRVLRINPKNLS